MVGHKRNLIKILIDSKMNGEFMKYSLAFMLNNQILINFIKLFLLADIFLSFWQFDFLSVCSRVSQQLLSLQILIRILVKILFFILVRVKGQKKIAFMLVFLNYSIISLLG